MGLVVSTPPTIEPLTVAEAKAQLNLVHDDDNDLISKIITAARVLFERTWNCALITQTITLTLDGVPANDMYDPDWFAPPGNWNSAGSPQLLLRRPPLISVTSISYVDTNGATQTWGASNYQVDATSFPGRVLPAYNQAWPTTRSGQINSLSVVYQAGYGATTALVTEPARQAIRMLIAHWYINRSAVLSGTISKEIELALTALRWSMGSFR